MARYATLGEVQAHLPSGIWAPGAGEPTAAKVQNWLDQQSAWVDNTLRWKYTVPVTDATDQATLGGIVAMLVAAQVWMALGGHSGDDLSGGRSLRKTALEMLAYSQATGQSRLVLPNTEESSTGEAAVMQPLGSFTDPDDGGAARVFDVGMHL
ncbi:MAG TPA: hypothetical protein VFU47_02585 [Armatimonadota bacterium]|nr:hypothetical protein [Armatimonadota bacterium]